MYPNMSDSKELRMERLLYTHITPLVYIFFNMTKVQPSYSIV